MTDEIRIRPFEGIEECRIAVDFQDRIWGAGFSERVPASLLHVLPRVGSVAIGAWTGGTGAERLVGLVFGVTGVESGEVVHWSDLLAVDPEYRDRGIGRRLKEAQRQAAREAGAVRMYWTFDPLEARNAWVNVRHLGATAREYAVEFYGVSDSELHSGLGTDRLVAVWELTGPDAGVAGRTDDGADDRWAETPHAFPVVRDPATGHPAPPESWSGTDDRMRIEGGRTRIPIPRDVQRLKREAPELATRWREATRAAFRAAFARGGAVRGIEEAEHGGLDYRIAPDPSAPLHPRSPSGELSP